MSRRGTTSSSMPVRYKVDFDLNRAKPKANNRLASRPNVAGSGTATKAMLLPP